MLIENVDGDMTSYTWDPENRLTGVAYPGGAGDASSFLADGRRYQKQLASTGQDTITIWDNQNVLIDANPTTGATIDRILYTSPGYWGDGGDLISLNQSSASSFYIGDASSNVRGLASAAQVITDSYLLKAFGEDLLATGSTPNVFRGAGMVCVQLDNLARMWMRARAYPTDLGRFVTVARAL